MMENMPTPMLVLTVGLPRSGKTTWARDQGCPVVNPDSIRLALHGQRFQLEAEPMVWAIAKIMVKALFLAGHAKVIVDATNTTRERRKFWNDSSWACQCHEIDTPKDVCIQRAVDLKDPYIIPHIERMAKQFEPVADMEYPQGGK